MKIDKELATAGVFVIISLIVLGLIPNQIEVVGDSAMNARFVPTVIAVALLVLSTLNLGLEFRKTLRARNAGEAISVKDLHVHVRPILLLAVFVSYAFALELVGFEVASIAAGGLILLLIGSKSWRFFLFVSVFTVAVGLIFRFVFNIPLATPGF